MYYVVFAVYHVTHSMSTGKKIRRTTSGVRRLVFLFQFDSKAVDIFGGHGVRKFDRQGAEVLSERDVPLAQQADGLHLLLRQQALDDGGAVFRRIMKA